MNAFFSQHYAALKNAVRRLLSSPLNTLLSLIVIGAALALPAAGWVLLDNLQRFAGNVSGVQQISIFMTTDAGKTEAAQIESRLRETRPGQWRFVARDEALEHLKETEGMADLVAGLTKNPLPDAFVVEPDDSSPETLEKLAETF
jgi:cell division transport system permease protein